MDIGPEANVLLGPFYELNKGYGKWDIKRNIRRNIGEGVILCGTENCGWFDYSTPGNIHFGFIAGRMNVPKPLSQAAGGYLEVKEGTANINNWRTLFEDPQDWAAVQFGYNLYKTYGSDITLREFQEALTTDVMDRLEPPPENYPIPGPPISQPNRYAVGAFNWP